jgi:pimeloyl-ACP methyl ester carboxylesterase
LVCAALLPERVSAAVVLGGVTDMGWSGAWQGWNSEVEGQIMRMADEETAIRSCIEQFGADGSGFNQAPDFDFAEPDKALRADERAGPAISLAETEAFRQGVVGFAQDAFVQGRPWTFNVNAITVPVRMIHGELDNVVPIAHSRHTAQLLPGSTLRILPRHGHLTTLAELPAVVLELSRSAKPLAL